MDTYRTLFSKSIAYRKKKEQWTPSSKSTPRSKRLLKTVCNSPFWAWFYRDVCTSLVVQHDTVVLPGLPLEFDGYKALFLSDLHLDVEPNALSALMSQSLPEHEIVILGGDFFDDFWCNDAPVLATFLSRFNKPIYAVLGNHDSVDMVDVLTELGVNVLLNTSTVLTKGDAQLLLTGIDDVSQFDGGAQRQCLEQASDAFSGIKVLVSHSPDALVLASRAGYDLQLSGHTHGGQWALFGRPLIKQTDYDFAVSGRWSYNGMQGITSTGFGSSQYPIRNIRPEVRLVCLSKKRALRTG